MRRSTRTPASRSWSARRRAGKPASSELTRLRKKVSRPGLPAGYLSGSLLALTVMRAVRAIRLLRMNLMLLFICIHFYTFERIESC